MAQRTKTSLADFTLVELKLAVVNHHNGEENEYLRTSVARDACYTSKNSIDWKLDQMLKVKTELAELFPLEGGPEVVGVQIARKLEVYESMQLELDELQKRHDADLAVYQAVTGEAWSPRPKSKRQPNSQAVMEKVAAILA